MENQTDAERAVKDLEDACDVDFGKYRPMAVNIINRLVVPSVPAPSVGDDEVDRILQVVIDQCPAAERVRCGEKSRGSSDVRAIIIATFAAAAVQPAPDDPDAALRDAYSAGVRSMLPATEAKCGAYHAGDPKPLRCALVWGHQGPCEFPAEAGRAKMPQLDYVCHECWVQQHAGGMCANCGSHNMRRNAAAPPVPAVAEGEHRRIACEIAHRHAPLDSVQLPFGINGLEADIVKALTAVARQPTTENVAEKIAEIARLRDEVNRADDRIVERAAQMLTSMDVAEKARRVAELAVPNCLSRTCFIRDCHREQCWGCNAREAERKRIATIAIESFIATEPEEVK